MCYSVDARSSSPAILGRLRWPPGWSLYLLSSPGALPLIRIRDFEFERLPNRWVRASRGFVAADGQLFLVEIHLSPKEWDSIVADLGQSYKQTVLAPT